MVRGKHLNELVRECNTAVGMARSWIEGVDLKLADQKTDVLEFITITVGDQRTISKQAIECLGVISDNRLTFKEHLTYIGGKCAATSCALA